LVAGLLGIINAAACFMLFGRHWSAIAWYAVLGIFAASLAQIAATALAAPELVMIGDVNVLAASLGACGVLAAARLSGL
jgi:hypothetical protein